MEEEDYIIEFSHNPDSSRASSSAYRVPRNKFRVTTDDQRQSDENPNEDKEVETLEAKGAPSLDPVGSSTGTTFQEMPEYNWLEELSIEKILGSKISGAAETASEGNIGETLYLIKWKNKSYLHVSWENQARLEQFDPQAKMKIRRYLLHKTEEERNSLIVPVDGEQPEYFNPDFVEIDRIISCDPLPVEHRDAKSEEELQGLLDAAVRQSLDVEVHYLVKWRGIPYNECSWERVSDLQNRAAEIFAFWQRQKFNRNFNYGVCQPSLHDYKKLETSPSFGGLDSDGLKLRDYQLEGVNWLLWNWWHKRSCILADEMGLGNKYTEINFPAIFFNIVVFFTFLIFSGKTIQTSCFLQQLRSMKPCNIRGPHLVISPLSLVRQWESELALWCPDFNCVVLHGNVDAKDLIVENEFYYQDLFSTKEDIRDAKRKNALKFDVLLTTYEIAVRDISTLSAIPWRTLVIDEAHRLKNPTSRVFERLLTLKREFCIMLTGTPLQNKTEELWALLHFADAQKFPNVTEFSRKFGDLKGSADVAMLHGVLKPLLLRRIKEDVEKSLPPKEETIIEV